MAENRAFAAALGTGSTAIWGMTSAERLRRIFVRCRLTPVAWPHDLPPDGSIVLALADWVYDEPLIAALAARPGSALIGPAGRPVAAHVGAGLAVDAAAALAGGTDAPVLGALTPFTPAALAYNAALRKRDDPVLERLDPANVRAVEARLFRGAYKGVTDIVTKYVWPRPARLVTRWCAEAHITPNQVTFASLILVLAAFALFWFGWFGWGLLAAWVMTFLDTVDGKLARVSLTSSPFGNIFDHGIDLIHPPFWWWAWYVGLERLGYDIPAGPLVLAIVLGGYVVQRATEGIFSASFGMQMHAWRRFDSAFRLITARRNPNLVILSLFVLAGRPEIGLVAVAVWTAACLAVHIVQLAQAVLAPRPLVSWLAR